MAKETNLFGGFNPLKGFKPLDMFQYPRPIKHRKRKAVKRKTKKESGMVAYKKRVKKGIVYGGKKLSLNQWANAESVRQQYGERSPQFKKYMKKI